MKGDLYCSIAWNDQTRPLKEKLKILSLSYNFSYFNYSLKYFMIKFFFFFFFIVPYSSVSFIFWAGLWLKTEKSSFTRHRSSCFAVSVVEDLGIEQELELNALVKFTAGLSVEMATPAGLQSEFALKHCVVASQSQRMISIFEWFLRHRYTIILVCTAYFIFVIYFEYIANIYHIL